MIDALSTPASLWTVIVGGGAFAAATLIAAWTLRRCWVDAETAEWVEAFCEQEDRTLSWLVRDAVREYREKREGKS